MPRVHILIGPSPLPATVMYLYQALGYRKEIQIPTTRPSFRCSVTRRGSLRSATTMASAAKPITISILLFFFFLTISLCEYREGYPTPAPWPHQFHSIIFMNNSGSLQIVDLWYDWPNGRNFNIIQNQLGKLLYDLEWNNGTSFFYTLDSNKECRTMHFEVGILRPNWLDGANYLGQRRVDGFLCNVWEKVDFIWYYEDVVSKRPVRWIFYTGMDAHVMTFEVGAVLEDAHWQAPLYCFDRRDNGSDPTAQFAITGASREHFLGGLLGGYSYKR